jgi:uncharacterized protein
MERDHERLELVTVGGRQLACAFHDAGDPVVVFCHGFRGEKTGPNRSFVRAARKLAQLGVSSVRFDQFGSGDSEGDFLDTSFTDWIASCRAVAESMLRQQRPAALFGQSMGGSAVLCAGSELPSLAAVVAWVPDACTDRYLPSPTGYMEEGGQRVLDRFWEEAHGADIPQCYASLTAPAYLVFGTADEYVSELNREALVRRAKPVDVVDVFDGYPHSAWTAEQTDDIIDRSVRFLAAHLLGSGTPSLDHQATRDRDRDPHGRARQARPRDGLGRPLPYGSVGVEPVSEQPLPPFETITAAHELLVAGRPFSAHEVFEARWKAGPTAERDLWQGLAQLCVGITHAERGNRTGALRLIGRARQRLDAYLSTAGPVYGLDLSHIIDWIRDLEREPDGASWLIGQPL